MMITTSDMLKMYTYHSRTYRGLITTYDPLLVMSKCGKHKMYRIIPKCIVLSLIEVLKYSAKQCKLKSINSAPYNYIFSDVVSKSRDGAKQII